MEVEVADSSVMIPGKEVEEPSKHSVVTRDSNVEGKKHLGMENGVCMDAEETRDQLEQMVFELRFQNEYLISQLKSFVACSRKPQGISKDNQDVVDVEELKAQLESLNKELTDEKKTRSAAEEALKHLQEAYAEADAKAQELSGKLSEG